MKLQVKLKKYCLSLLLLLFLALPAMGYTASSKEEMVLIPKSKYLLLKNNLNALQEQMITLENHSNKRATIYKNMRKQQENRLIALKALNKTLEEQLITANASLQNANQYLMEAQKEYRRKINEGKRNTIIAIIGGILVSSLIAVL